MIRMVIPRQPICFALCAIVGWGLGIAPAADNPPLARNDSTDAAPTIEQLHLLAARRKIDWQQVDDDAALRDSLTRVLQKRNRASAALSQQLAATGKALVDQAIVQWQADVRALGSDPAELAKQWHTDVAAIEAEIRWHTLWSEYLRQRLNDENLKRFFARTPYRYDGTRADIGQIFIAGENAKAQLSQIADEIRSQKISFVDAAKAHSQAGSAIAGGRIGWISADGDLPAVVADAALSSQRSTLLPVIVSPLGGHLVYVYDKQPGTVTFDTLADHRRLRRDAADFLFDHLAKQNE